MRTTTQEPSPVHYANLRRLLKSTAACMFPLAVEPAELEPMDVPELVATVGAVWSVTQTMCTRLIAAAREGDAGSCIAADVLSDQLAELQRAADGLSLFASDPPGGS